MTKPEVIQVVTTTSSQAEAQAIARHLVEQRLAACAQVSGPVQSVYRWQGKIENDQEWTCSAKTLRGKYAEVEEAIRKLHSYDEPQIVEPDGSFVWAGEDDGQAWQVDGVLYDEGPSLSYVEMSGSSPPNDFDQFLAALGWPASPVMFQLVEAGVFLAEDTFRSFTES